MKGVSLHSGGPQLLHSSPSCVSFQVCRSWVFSGDGGTVASDYTAPPLGVISWLSTEDP